MREQRIAVIGAGISGLACAARLKSSGHHLTLFDKSRGAGGRLCTRRTDAGRFDHGAQYFTATHPTFRQEVLRWSELGWVKIWHGQFGYWQHGKVTTDHEPKERWVGAPRMSALGRSLAKDLTIHLAHKVIDIDRANGKWVVTCENGFQEGDFDWIVLTCPGPQTSALLNRGAVLQEPVATFKYAPCWSVMVRFDDTINVEFDGIQLDHPILAWAARDNSKPDRDEGERWVIQTQASWSTDQIEVAPETAGLQVLLAFREAFGVQVNGELMSSHRWRYANAESTHINEPLVDIPSKIGICGDGPSGPRVEHAWLSGHRLADLILQ